MLFSSPQLTAEDELLWYLPSILSPSVVRPHLWTTCPLKPLGQFSSKFMWNLLLKGGLNICTNGHGLLIKMAAMPIDDDENTYKSSSPEPRKLQGWIFVYSIIVSRSTKFFQMMTLCVDCWPLTFSWQGQICIPMHLYWENVEKSC